jgi:hypothetical protein
MILKKFLFLVIPVKTGIQRYKEKILDSCFRRNDDLKRDGCGVNFQRAKLIQKGFGSSLYG